MLIEHVIGEKELALCKMGFTWKYFVEEVCKNGIVYTVISFEMLYKTPSCIRIGIPFPFDSGRRENVTVDAIRDCMFNLKALANEANVAVQEYDDRTVIAQGIKGGVVQDFIANLAKINRVLVVVERTGDRQ